MNNVEKLWNMYKLTADDVCGEYLYVSEDENCQAVVVGGVLIDDDQAISDLRAALQPHGLTAEYTEDGLLIA